MPFSDEQYNLHVEIDTQECELADHESEKIDKEIQPLDAVIREFPKSDLYVTIVHHPRSQAFQVKTSLLLPGKTLVTGDKDEYMLPSFERCIRKLVQRVRRYKAELSDQEEYAKTQKGTHQEIHPTRTPDIARIEQAVEDKDYAAFRAATLMYEEPVSKRAGRWVQRYPEVEAQLGEQLLISDIVEELFLNAFERYRDRPREVPFGEWLEGLLDPSIKLLIKQPEQELANINFVRSAREAERG